jgi:hypothetical protein
MRRFEGGGSGQGGVDGGVRCGERGVGVGGSAAVEGGAAHFWLPGEALRAHCGSAVTPVGTSVGHALNREHLG